MIWPLTALVHVKHRIKPSVVPLAKIWAICATGAFQRIGVPTVTTQSMNEYTLTPEDTWDKFCPDITFRDILVQVDLIEGLQKLDVPGDEPVEPLGGCGSLFTDLAQPEYPDGEAYTPEPDYPLYVGGADGPIEIRRR